MTYSRMKRFRADLPGVIRPDIITTQDGMVSTELDSVPGGIVLNACMSRLYARPSASVHAHPHPPQLVGGPDGMIDGLLRCSGLSRLSPRDWW